MADNGINLTELDEERAKEIGYTQAVDPVFEPVTDNNLKCSGCRFRLEGSGVLRCHKYDMKPAEVINGGPCPRFKAKR